MNNVITIYFIRHAESVGNKEKRLCGMVDFELSELGQTQALNLGKFMKDSNLDIIYSSPLDRAFNTAKCIQSNHNSYLPLKIISNFREVNFGALDGWTHKLANKYYPYEMRNWTFIKRYPEGLPLQENIDCAQKRFLDSLNFILETTNYSSICVVTHGTILRSVIAKFLNLNKDEYSKIPSFKNASITKVTYDKELKKYIVNYVGYNVPLNENNQ